MDIKILDSWLRDFLDTAASPAKIAECLSLSGPSVEKITKIGNDSLYSIEITTNRIDAVGVYGIAREAAAILPRFGIKAKLKSPKAENGLKFSKKVSYLDAQVDSNLCFRFTAVLIRNVKVNASPELIKKRLEASGVRAINNVVDISNYIMLGLGQPVHTFDYDKIKNGKMILRESSKGEKITTLDGKVFTLDGGDIVIEDGEGRLIDLAGVMGGSLSAVDENTKNVLLFVQTYNPIKIRRTSMGLAQRTLAATIFEKGTDPELVELGISEGIKLFEKNTGGRAEAHILDIYPNSYKPKKISVDYKFICDRLGIQISKRDIVSYLSALGFECSWSGNLLNVFVPSFRSLDVFTYEDVVEEIARIYGYHNLPSILMDGALPGFVSNPQFTFEQDIKNLLSGWGGVEVYTLSLVEQDNGLMLKNPLGADSTYLRTSLMASLCKAAKDNVSFTEQFHLFEMANVYLPKRSDLPEERLMLGGIFSNYSYREAKGIVEALLLKLNIKYSLSPRDEKGFDAGKCLTIKNSSTEIGKIGCVENSNFIYYELPVRSLFANQVPRKYKDIAKFPPQIEDMTLVFPTKTRVGDVMTLIRDVDTKIDSVELKDIYGDAYTFRLLYQDPGKTLTNKEVEEIRGKILKIVESKFGGKLKE